MREIDSTQISVSIRPALEVMRAHAVAGAQTQHEKDIAMGYFACLLGRSELNTTRAPWRSTARALVRASYFNQGVREARRLLENRTNRQEKEDS